MVKRTVLFLILSLCFQGFLLAEEKTSVGDRIIGSTFKTLAKAFVVTVDIDALKKNNINKLKGMKEDKFKQRYAGVYEVIKDLPANLKVNYGIRENMTREQAIKNLEVLDKKKIYAIIDAVPDVIIAQQFKQYLSEKKHGLEESNVVEEINKFWQKITKKANALI